MTGDVALWAMRAGGLLIGLGRDVIVAGSFVGGAVARAGENLVGWGERSYLGLLDDEADR